MAISTAELLAQENAPIKTSDLVAMEEKTPAPEIPAWIKPFNMMDQPEPMPYDFDTAINKHVEAAGGDVNKTKKDFTESMYEGFVQPWEKMGYTAAASFNRGMAVFSTHLDLIGEYLGGKTGASKGGAFESAAKTYNENTEYWQKRANEAGAAFIPELFGEALGGAVPGIAEFVLNIPYAGLLGAANTEQQTEKGRSELSNALVEAGKRGTLGIVFNQLSQFKKYLSAPMMGGVFGLQTAAEGGDTKEIAKGVGTGLIYGLTSPGGRMGLNEIRRNFEKEIVRQKAELPPEIVPKPTEELQPLTAPEVLPVEQGKVSPVDIVQPVATSEGKQPFYDALSITTKPDVMNVIISDMKSNLQGGTKGGLQGYDANGEPIYAGSGYPDWFSQLVKDYSKDKTSPSGKKDSIDAKTFINIIDKGLKGDKLTSRQQGFWEDVNKIADRESGKSYAPLVEQFQKAKEVINETRKQFAEAEINPGEIQESSGDLRGSLEAKGYSTQDIETALKELAEERAAIQGEAVGQSVKLSPEEVKSKQANIPGTDSFNLVNPETEISKPLSEQVTPKNADMFNPAFAPEAGFRRQPEAAEPTDAITRRSDLVRFLNEKLDIPIRTGRFMDKALGIFKLREEVIRTGKANDIEVIAHEIGHGLQKFLYPEDVSVKGLKSLPFSEFKNELDPLATQPKAGQEVTPEGFAEFIRLYVTNPPMAKEKAPSFYDHFEHLLTEKSPETLDILKDAARQYDRWLKQPELQRVLSQVSVGQKEKREVSFEKIYTAAVDDLYPLKKIVDEMAPNKLKASDDPYKLARLMRGIDGKVETFLDHSPFKFKTYEEVGKSFKDILKPLKDNLDEFRAYILSRRTLDLSKRNIETGILPADAKVVVEKYNDQFSKSFGDLKEFQDHTLTYLKDSGMIDQKTYDKIKTLNEDYVPLYRIMEDNAGKKVGMGSGLVASNQIKKIKGSWRDIQDPLESIIKNTALYINAAEKNAVGESLIKLAEKTEGMGKFVEKIPTPTKGTKGKIDEIFTAAELTQMAEIGIDPDASFTIFRAASFVPKDNVISVWDKGDQKLYQVHPDIAKVFQALDKENSNLLMRLLATPASWLRAGATLTPEFIGRNPLRDQFSAFVYSKYGFIPGYDLAKGIFSMAKKDQMYWDWKKGGGDHSMLVSMDRDYLQDKLGDLLQKYPVMNRIKNPIECLRILSEIGEEGTRIGEFRKGIKKEGATKEGIQAAALAAREVTLDFNRKGATGKAVNMITAFWNANVQGTDKMIREFKENPLTTSLKTAAALTLPSVLLAIATHDDPRIKEIPGWERDMFWCIPTENNIWRIPKPFELGILFGSVPERITHYIMDQDPHAFKGILTSAWSGLAPGFVPTAAIPIMENWANKSTFFDRPIVPNNRTDLLSEYQYGPYTTETAKQLGSILGKLPWMENTTVTSPAKIDNLVRGWTGGLGMYALQIADKGLEVTGITPRDYEKPAASLSEIPFIKAFHTRYPSSNAESIQRFYDHYKEADQTLKTVKALISQENNPDAAIKLMEANNMENLRGNYTAISNIHSMIDAIYINPTMTGDEKREFIDMLYMQMIDVAKNGNEVFDMIKENKKEMQTIEAAPIERKPQGLRPPVF